MKNKTLDILSNIKNINSSKINSLISDLRVINNPTRRDIIFNM